MRKPGSKTGMSPVCENRPHMVYARVCRGMQGHVQNDREIFVRDLGDDDGTRLRVGTDSKISR